MTRADRKNASLESLAESPEFPVEVLHPGGLKITAELAALCGIGKESLVLDVASGTGESACDLRESLGCRVVGIDASAQMIQRARKKARERRLSMEFIEADALDLPFEEGTFDAVISECTMSLLDKNRAIREMTRVTRPDGFVGIHDIFWKKGAPEHLKQRLSGLEGERPETLEGWKRLFETAGLREVSAVDRSEVLSGWMRQSMKQLGFAGQIKMIGTAVRNWGPGGLLRILESMLIFRSRHLGYGIIVGRKLQGHSFS